MANRLSNEKRKLVLNLLCEGSSIRSASRISVVDKDTICRVILDFGRYAQNFMDEQLRGLHLKHIEVDEMHTFVGKKQARLTVEEKATRHDIGEVYLWTAIDRETKLIPAHLIGKRSANNARRLMRDLSERLEMPTPHESDDHAYSEGRYQRITQLSTDGFAAYPEAVNQFFGPYAAHGVLIKQYRNANMVYSPSEMISTDRRPIIGQITPRSICTSHIERHNLTVRTFMRRFTRLSLGFSKSLEHLQASCAMFLAYYNWVWRTRYPDDSGKRGKLRPTAAMLAKVTDRLWKFNDLYETIIQYC